MIFWQAEPELSSSFDSSTSTKQTDDALSLQIPLLTIEPLYVQKLLHFQAITTFKCHMMQKTFSSFHISNILIQNIDIELILILPFLSNLDYRRVLYF